MAKQLIQKYTFSVTAKTIVLNDFKAVVLERLQLIIDTTTNKILYNFADSSVATATVSGNIITLSTVGTAAVTDTLMIIYDALGTDPQYDMPPWVTNLGKQLSVSIDALGPNASAAVALALGAPAQPVFLVGPAGDLVGQYGDAVPVVIKPALSGVSDETSTVYNQGNPLQPKFAPISASSSGANTLVAGIPGKKIRVVNYTLVASGAVNAKFQSSGNVATDITGLLYMSTNTGAAPAYTPVGHFETNPGESLVLNLSGATAVGGHLTYLVI